MPEKIKPLLHKKEKHLQSTLKSKEVNIQGTNEFNIGFPNSKAKTDNKKNKNDIPHQDMATKTAKMSPSTILKINLIQSFIPQSSAGKRRTINETISWLIDEYANMTLSERQKETFKQLYEMQYKDL